MLDGRLRELRRARTLKEVSVEKRSASERTAKRGYQKPELTQVPLKPEEAVLGACKISGTAGPGHSKGQGGCTAVPSCSSIGS